MNGLESMNLSVAGFRSRLLLWPRLRTIRAAGASRELIYGNARISSSRGGSMKRSIICGLFAALALTAAVPAAAQGDNKYAGVGFIIGEPTGLDAKFFLSNVNALQFGLAWSLEG